jgi:hypothetical protein
VIIIGADYHAAFQQIALLDTETGELDAPSVPVRP